VVVHGSSETQTDQPDEDWLLASAEVGWQHDDLRFQRTSDGPAGGPLRSPAPPALRLGLPIPPSFPWVIHVQKAWVIELRKENLCKLWAAYQTRKQG